MIMVSPLKRNIRSGLIVRGISARPGTYSVSIVINSIQKIEWLATNGLQAVPLRNGLNKFIVKVADANLFDIMISAANIKISSRFIVISINVQPDKLEPVMPVVAKNVVTAPISVAPVPVPVAVPTPVPAPVAPAPVLVPTNVTPVNTLISVILPTLNRLEGFRTVISHILQQIHTDFELIAIDDGSAEDIFQGKKAIISNLNDSRFTLRRNEVNLGTSATLNLGISYAKGGYVTWISDDNEYYPNYLSTLFDPQYDFTYAYWDHFNMTTKQSKTIGAVYANMVTLVNNFMGLGAFMWSKSVMDRIGTYNVELVGCDDYDYLVRTYIHTNKIGLKQVPIMKYVSHPDSHFQREHQQIMERKKQLMNIYNALILPLKKSVIAVYLLNQPNNCLDRIRPLDDRKCNIYVSSESLIIAETDVIIIPRTFCEVIWNVCRSKITHILYDSQEVLAIAKTMLPSSTAIKLNTDVTTSVLPLVLPTNPKISIVMAYHNRKSQLFHTMKTIADTSYENYEVIIVDDASSAEHKLVLADLADTTDLTSRVKLITIDPADKSWCNPCVPYNIGLKQATGDIVILQNPEVCHMHDVITYVSQHVTHQNYISMSCLALPSFEANEKLYKMKPEVLAELADISVWYNHPTKPTYYHFCAAITTSNLQKIGGFSQAYRDGYCFDDDDLLLKIKYDLQLELIIPDETIALTIHQYHPPSICMNCTALPMTNPIRIKWESNKSLFETKLQRKLALAASKAGTIPHIFNCYWDKSKLSYLNYMTVKSFCHYNPHWQIHVYVPVSKTEAMTWVSSEQKSRYVGRDWWPDLLQHAGVTICPVDFDAIGFSNSAAEVVKSDYLRWHILSTAGGIWSDFDILYVKSVEDMLAQIGYDFDTLFFNVGGNEKYYPIGFFMSTKSNPVFARLKHLAKRFYNPLHYQSIGAQMIGRVWPTVGELIKEFPQTAFKIEDKHVYLPYEWHSIHNIFEANGDSTNIVEKTIGIHWFNGSCIAKAYQNNIDVEINNNSVMSVLVKKFQAIN